MSRACVAVILIICAAELTLGRHVFNPGRRGHINQCFRCSYEDCLSMSHVCDGWEDCRDGLDEDGCEKVCPYPEYYRCSDSSTCMDSYHVCDGRADCPNGEDEAYHQCTLFSRRGRFGRMERLKKSLSYTLELEDIYNGTWTDSDSFTSSSTSSSSVHAQ